MMLTIQEKVSCHSADLLFDWLFLFGSCFKLPFSMSKINSPTKRKHSFGIPFKLVLKAQAYWLQQNLISNGRTHLVNDTMLASPVNTFLPVFVKCIIPLLDMSKSDNNTG